MRRRLTLLVWLTGTGILLAACGTTTTHEARQEDKKRKDFKVALAERQVARRQKTAEQCRRRGVAVPDKYRQKGGGMLEDYVSGRPPCGIPARDRVERAEADFRATWAKVIGETLPLGYEWLLSVKRRLGTWVDEDGLTPGKARRIWREAQWVLVGRQAPPVVQASTQPASDSGARFFAELDSALNSALDNEGIACRRGGERHPCF
ncbi:MAG: hypothetical protein ACE5K9_07555 [Candidatus Methylomirabilales bacterium]